MPAGFGVLDFFLKTFFFFASLLTDTKDGFGRTEKRRGRGRGVVQQHLTLTVKTDPVTIAFPLRLLQHDRNPSWVALAVI